MRISERMASLLKTAATCFHDGKNPFHPERLSDSQVTFAEYEQLSELIGTVLSGFVRSTDKAQTEILLLSAAEGDMPAERMRAFVEQWDALKRWESGRQSHS